MTGQIRSFFIERRIHTFISMIHLCKEHYSNILIIAVVNGEYTNGLPELIASLGVSFIIIDYNTHDSKYRKAVELKNKSTEYLSIKKKYQENKNNLALNEISDPDTRPYHWVQFHQLHVGISQMLEYELLNNIQFHILMRTRFDIDYKQNFYPHIPEDPLKRVSFNDELEGELISTMKKFSIDSNMNSLLNYLKSKMIEEPHCRVDNEHLPISFGGMYIYNTISLENILNGSSDILYAFNDFIYFAKREVFLKLSNLFNDCGIRESPILVPHFYAQEAQLSIFCINNGINILMFTQINSNGYGYKYGPTNN
jgi:hypothetical protein